MIPLLHPLLLAFAEAVASLGRGWRRLVPMALGITWGMASVMVLLAVAAGFERSQKQALAAYGDRFVLLRLNRAELDRAAGGRERRLMMDRLDVERLRRGAPAIRRLSPMNMAYRARITGASGAGANVFISGSLPEISRIRHLPLVEGRFYNETDEAHRRRVIVLGPMARQQLFGRAPAVTQKVRIAGFSTAAIPLPPAPLAPEVAGRRGGAPVPASLSRPAPGRALETRPAAARDVGIAGELFEVIGVLGDVEVQRESYVSVARMAFIPFATSCAVFDDRYNTLLIEPRSAEDKELALHQFAQVMGARYGFEPGDRNAVLIYFDAVGRAQTIDAVFRGLRYFLSAVGILILAIGALGIVNVVLVSLAARRYEIGLRKALGATPGVIYLQLFLETALSCAFSGALGFLLGALGLVLLRVLPLPEGFSPPALEWETSAWAFGLLAVTAGLAAVYPAQRAASMPPAEALRAPG